MARSAIAIASCLLSTPVCLGLRIGKSAQSPYDASQAAFQQQMAYPQATYQQGYPQQYGQGYPQAVYGQNIYAQNPYSQNPYGQQQAAYNPYSTYGQSAFPNPYANDAAQMGIEVKEAPGLVEGFKNLTAFVKRHAKTTNDKINSTLTEFAPLLNAMKGGARLSGGAVKDINVLFKARKAHKANETLSDAEERRVEVLQKAKDQFLKNVRTSALVGAALGASPAMEKSSPMERAVHQALAVGGIWVDEKNQLKLF